CMHMHPWRPTMSDEHSLAGNPQNGLDPDVSRWFAQANAPLPGAEFQARVTARLAAESRGGLNINTVLPLIRAATCGISTGLFAPFRLRFGYSTALMVTAAALTLWMGLQAV